MCSSTIGSASKRQGFHSGRISPGSWAASRCPSADTQTVVGDLKKRWSWRIAEGFSKKNSVRDPDPVDMSVALERREDDRWPAPENEQRTYVSRENRSMSPML